MRPHSEEEIARALDRIAEAGRQPSKRRAKGNGVHKTLPTYADEALALSFADRHADDLRYVAAWSRWLSFDGLRWRVDDTLFAFDQVRDACREAATACEADNERRTLASAKTVAAVHIEQETTPARHSPAFQGR